MAEGKGRSRRATEMERRAGSAPHRTGARPASRRTGKGERNPIWPHTGAGKKTGRCDSKNGKRSTINVASRRSDRGRHRRSCFELDAYSSLTIAGGRARKAGQTREAFASARCRTRRGHQSRGQRCAARTGGFAGSEPATRFFSFSWPDWGRQNRAVPCTRRVSVRRRKRHDQNRHERVHGETHRCAFDRRAARIRRLRRRRTTFRSSSTQAVFGRALRRNRKSASGRFQRIAASAR